MNDGSQATRDKQEAARELVELKDRNTALEQQMMEYIETIKDQNKVVRYFVYVLNTVSLLFQSLG